MDIGDCWEQDCLAGAVTSVAVQCSCKPITIMCCHHRRSREAHIRGTFKFLGLLKKHLLRPCNRGVSAVKNVYVYRVITLRNDCIFSFLW